MRIPTRKAVRFDPCVRMVLVPMRRDYDAATMRGVWWGARDVAGFRVAAMKHFLKHDEVVRHFLKRDGMMAQSSSIGVVGAAASEEEPNNEEVDGQAKPPVSKPAPPLPGKAESC